MTQAAAVSTGRSSRAVRKAAATADQLIEANRRAKAGEPPLDAQPPAPELVAAPPPEPSPQPVLTQPAPQIAAAPTPTPSPTAPTAAPREETVDYWRDRFRTAEGAFRVEQARLQGTIDGLNGRVEDLEQQLASRQPVAPVVDPATLRLEDFFTPAEVKEFGPDALRSLMGGVVKVVAAQVGASVKPLESRVQAMSRGERERRERKFVDELTEGLPNWKAINADPAWQAWLADPDEATGVQRDALLKKAQQELNAQRVLAIFNRFLSTQPGGVQRTPRDPAERLMPAGRPSGGPAGYQTPTAQRPISRSDIRVHYARKHRDKTWAKSPECAAAEALINAAVQAGTVT